MTEAELKNLLKKQLPQLIAEDAQVRDFILRTVSNYYAPKEETQDRFDQIMEELRRDREEQKIKWDQQNRKWDQQREEENRKWDEQNRKWDEQNHKWDQQNRKWDEQREEQNHKWDQQNRKWDEQREEQNHKWDQQNRKWEESDSKFKEIMARMDRESEENSRKFDQTLEEIRELNRKHDSTIGALGSRWGLHSEASFRNALKGILEDSFGVEVLNINEHDDTGEVFGRPDQVELDLIIKNGLLIICEIKSSMSKADMYIFDRKVLFYEKRHQKKANRKLVISPMVDDRAKPIAQDLGIEVYSYADTVKLD